MSIGKLDPVELRELWLHEERDFSKWLDENIDVLSDALGLPLTVEEREKSVGSFSVDLIAKDANENRVIIENQLEPTNHDHLGKLLTYLVNLESKVAIWIVKEARPEHIRVISWLNEITPSDMAFYLVLLKAYRIGDSEAAPLFTPIVAPSEQSKQIGHTRETLADTDILHLKFWEQLLQRAKEKGITLHEGRRPEKDSWLYTGAGKTSLTFEYLIRHRRALIKLEIGNADKVYNKRIFDALSAHKDRIEQDFGEALMWDRADEKIGSRILFDIKGKGGLKSPEDKWPSIQDAMIEAMDRFSQAFKPHIQALRE
jgi:hypothetical protein